MTKQTQRNLMKAMAMVVLFSVLWYVTTIFLPAALRSVEIDSFGIAVLMITAFIALLILYIYRKAKHPVKYPPILSQCKNSRAMFFAVLIWHVSDTLKRFLRLFWPPRGANTGAKE